VIRSSSSSSYGSNSKHKTATTKRTRRLRALLRLEDLEERVTPAVFTWTGAVSSDWSNAGNWTPGSGTDAGILGIPDAPGDSAVFGNASNVTVNVSAPVTVDSITFSNTSGAYTIGGSQISLDGSGISQSGSVSNTVSAPLAIASPATALTLTVAGGTTFAATGALSGTGDLNKEGTGVLVLKGNNTYTGGTHIDAGTLQLGTTQTASIPAGYAAYYSFDDLMGTTTVVNQGSATGENGSLDQSAAITSSGETGNGLDLTGAVGSRMDITPLTLAGGTWTVSADFKDLYGTGDYRTLFRSGPAGTTDHEIIIQGGTWELGSYGSGGFSDSGYAIPSSYMTDNIWHNITAVGSGGKTTFYIDGVRVGQSSIASVQNVAAIGAFNSNGGNTGSQHFAQTIDEVYIYNTIALSPSQVLNLIGQGTGAANNPIPDGSSVVVAGSATFDLTGFPETIGDLSGSGTVTDSVAGSVVTLTLGGDNASTTFSGTIQNGSGTVAITKLGNGILTLQGANTYTGGTSIQAGTLQLAGADNRLLTTAAVAISSGAFLDLDNTNQTLPSLTGTGSVINSAPVSTTPILTLNLASGFVSLTNTLGSPGQNSFGFTKLGAAFLTASSANTYTGPTTIAGGTIAITADNQLGTAPTSFVANQLTLQSGGILNVTGAFALSPTRGITLGSGGGTISPQTAGVGFTYSGSFAGGGGLTKTAPGDLVLNGTATGSSPGAINALAGRVEFNNSNVLGSAALTVGTGGEFAYTGNTPLVLPNSVTLQTAAIIASLNAPLTLSNTILPSTGSVIINKESQSTSSVLLSGNGVSLTGALTIQVGGGTVAPGSAEVDNAINGGFAVIKSQTGLLVLGNSGNGFSGGLSIQAGILQVTQNGELGSTAGTTVITSGGALGFAGNVNYSNPEPVTVLPNPSTSTDYIINASGNNTFAGNIGQPTPASTSGFVGIRSDSGTLTLAGNVTLDAQTLTVGGAGNTTFTGFVSGSSISRTSYSATVTSTPTVTSYWRLDDTSGTTAVNTVNGSEPLTYANAPLLNQPGALAADPDTAVTFNGTNQYATFPTTGVFQLPVTTSQTFETFFKTTASGGGVILGIANAGVTPGGAASGFVPELYVGTDGKVRASFGYHGSSSSLTSVAAYNDNQWHYVAMSYNSSTLTETLYVDGTVVSRTAAADANFASGSYTYSLGTGDTASGWTAGNGTWYYFKGSLDDTAVYNSVLSASTIAAHESYLTSGPSSSGFNLTKTGSGTMTIGGGTSYSGTTTVSAGTLLVDTFLPSGSPITVASGATLGGNGSVGSVTSAGIVHPGLPGAPGGLTVTGNLALNSGSLVLDLANSNTYDKIFASGSSDNISGTALSLNIGLINSGDTFTILSGSSPVQGTFVNLPDSTSTLTIGSVTFSINYAAGFGGDNVVLTAMGSANPSLVSTVLNGGIAYVNSTIASSQHSMVENVVYSFGSAVMLTTSNFTLTGIGGTTSAPNVALASSNGGTVWTVTFTGAGVNNTTKSIGDGEYSLVLSGVLGITGASTYDFFRLLGDMDGNGTVDSSDFNILISSFLRGTADPAYLGADDLDGNNKVDGSDFNIFVSNFLKKLPDTTLLH
jgi:fibronectin-binding autotransporter adhesin